MWRRQGVDVEHLVALIKELGDTMTTSYSMDDVGTGCSKTQSQIPVKTMRLAVVEAAMIF